jgi:hypothetical protein
MAFHAKIYAIKECVMENIEKDYMGGENLHSL